jgi:hypothetical protein
MYVPAGNAARENMLSLQPQAVGAPPAPPGNGAAPAPAGAEGAQAMGQAAGQADIKPPVSSTGGPSDVQSSSKGEQVGQESAHKRRRTADLVSRLDSISRDI